MKQLPTTAVLQDLGGSDKSKIGFVLGNIIKKLKLGRLSPNLAKPRNVKNNLQKTCTIQNKVVHLQKKLKITNEIY